MLKISNLEKSYGSFKVLKGLNMNVNTGDIYGFLGKNGCGKTTTMNIVSNIIHKDGGKIEFSKKDKKIGYLPESPSLFTYMNGYEYLEYIASCCSYKGDKKARIDEVLQLTGMQEGGKRRIKGYSRGMNQRLGIAAAIFDNPDLLILDEPTSALDPQGRAEVMNIITKLADMGTTIILCTHILSDVERVANRIGIIRDGRMALEGTIDEIKAQYNRNGRKIRLAVFGDSQQAIPVINEYSGGQFTYDKRNGNFEIPLNEGDDEQLSSQKLLAALSQNNIIPSMFEMKTKTIEEIYLETIN